MFVLLKKLSFFKLNELLWPSLILFAIPQSCLSEDLIIADRHLAEGKYHVKSDCAGVKAEGSATLQGRILTSAEQYGFPQEALLPSRGEFADLEVGAIVVEGENKRCVAFLNKDKDTNALFVCKEPPGGATICTIYIKRL